MSNTDTTALEFEQALLQVNRIKAAEIFEACYAESDSFDRLEHITMHALERIGAGWESGTVSLSQVYMSGVICEELIGKYLPLSQRMRTDIPKMAIAVLLDHHALGKRIVYSVLRASGLDIMDFGQGLDVDEIVTKTVENKVEFLLISTLMLHSALKVKDVKEKLIAHGSSAKIIVGGAPFRFDKNLWRTVGADVDGKSASALIKTMESLMEGSGTA